MLIVEAANQIIVNLLGHSKEEIDQLKKQKWHCPSCGQPLVLKNGLIKQAHFAHRSKHLCQAFSEGETVEHLEGKKLLAEWCQQDGVPYQLEAYLPELKQRPDLLIAGRIAIEFQCSHLSLQRLCERTANYQRHGYRVVWLMGSSFFLTKTLSHLQRSCVNYHQNVGFYYWELDVQGQALRCQIHLEEIVESGQLYFEEKLLPIGGLPLLRSLNFPRQAEIFIRRTYEGGQMLLANLKRQEQNLVRREAKTMSVQEQLYCQGTHLRELSNVFFLPITQPLLAKESTVIWRILIWQCLEAVPCQRLMELSQCFLKQLKDKQVPFHVMPLIDHEHAIRLFLTDYLSLLKKFKLIRIADNQIKIIKRPEKYLNSGVRRQAIMDDLKKYKHISVTPHKDML